MEPGATQKPHLNSLVTSLVFIHCSGVDTRGYKIFTMVLINRDFSSNRDLPGKRAMV